MSFPRPHPNPERLSGTVERVTFHSPESGFCVLKVKIPKSREPVTLVGACATVHPGEEIRAEGAWTRDAKHGSQFKADKIELSTPHSPDGIERFLAGGLIKGIGGTYAKRLVKKFGTEVLDLLDHQSARLEEVPGIGPTRRRRIKAAWEAQKGIREIMIFLHAHGVGTARAARIHKTYGDEAIEMVKEDPYRLAKDIPGIGFRSADQIAARLGMPPDAPERAGAALDHLLLEATGKGHCALPSATLVSGVAELTGMTDMQIRPVLEKRLAEELLIRTSPDDLIYLPHLRKAEIRVAETLHRLAGQFPTLPGTDIAAALARQEKDDGIRLAPMQADAIEKVLRHRAIVITGGPGTGKTTLIRSLLKVVTAKNVIPLLAAPTGRAAKRLSEATGLEAKTLHRLLEFKDGSFQRNTKNPLEGGLVVIDETSMVDIPLASRLLSALPPNAHLILVGDPDQLPSVGPGNFLRDLIESNAIPVVRLNEIFRQAAGSAIVRNAHRILSGEIPESGTPEEDFFVIRKPDPESIAETLVRLVTDRIPARLGGDPADITQVLCPMNRGSLGTIAINQLLQEKLNPPDARPSVHRFGWEFRIGDKVIQTRNNYDKEVFNGDIGRIRDIVPDEQEVQIRFDDRELIYDFSELDELSPAYAISIHKSQGSEFPAVVLPMATQHYMMLQRNLLYTGITRGKKLVVVVGDEKAVCIAAQRSDSKRRWGGLPQLLKHPAP